MPDTKKTKRELLAEIEELRNQVQRENQKEETVKAAQQVRDLYESYIEVGFTPKQAWELTRSIVKQAVNK